MFRARFLGWWLVAATLLVYLPATRNGFVNLDDKDYVTENPVVQRGVTWSGIKWAFGAWHASNWHPVTWLSHMVDCGIFGLNPAGHHLINLLLHAVNAGLLFGLWLRLTGAKWASATVAAFFAWHPLHVESVAWIAERKDVLSTFFALLTLLTYVHGVRATGATGRLAGTRAYWLALIFFALGLMAKPMLVTLPFVMLLLDWWPLQRDRPAGWLLVEKWPFLLLAAAGCVITVLAQRAEAMAPLAKFSLGLRLENVVTAYATYLYLALWPARLAVFYPLIQPSWPVVVLAAGLLLGITGLVWRRAAAQPYLAVGWLWYLGTLVPVIGLVQVGDQAMADRYTYFPLIGIFLGCVWALADGGKRFPGARCSLGAVAILALGICVAMTERQLGYWRDSETLFRRDLAVARDSGAARLNLGEALQEDHRLAEALVEYQRALVLDPRRHEVYHNIGRILSDEGKPEAALEYCRRAVELDKNSAESRIGLGVVLGDLGRYEEAVSEFTAAAGLDAGSAAPHFQMGRALLRLGRDAEAVGQFEAALRREPDNLGMLLYTARVLAADRNAAGRNGREAFELAQRAAQLAGGQAVVLDTLAMACAETGRFDEAVRRARQALAAARAGGDREDAPDIEQRLELYEQRQPFRMAF
jgi:tetratricopeptide (TPR) repeat protein